MSPPDPSEVARKIEAIFSQSEFQEPWTARALRVVQGLIEALGAWFAGTGLFVQLAIFLGLLVLLVLIVVHLVTSYRRIMANDTSAAASSTSDVKNTSPRSLLDEAARLAAAGQTREAARALQQGMLLLHCERHGARWDPSLSDGEWLVRFGRPSSLTEFTRATQRVAFSPASSGDALSACEAALRAALAEGAA